MSFSAISHVDQDVAKAFKAIIEEEEGGAPAVEPEPKQPEPKEDGDDFELEGLFEAPPKSQ